MKTTIRSLKPVTLAYFAAFITLGLFSSILGPTLPGLAENTHTRLGEIGFLFSARSLGYMLGSLRGGKAFDRFPGHYLLAFVLFCIGGMVLLAPILSHLWVLTLVLLLLGIGEGVLDIGVNLLLVWTHRGRTGPFLNALHFFFGLGAFLSPIIVAQTLLITGEIKWAFWSLTFFALPVALWLLRLNSPNLIKEDRENGNIQNNIFLILLISGLFFLYVGAEVSFGGWIYTYATSLGLGDNTTVAYLNAAFWGALTTGRLIAIPLSGRFPPKKIIIFDLAGCLVSLALILFFPSSYLAVWVGTVSIGFFMASIFPTLLAFAENKMVLSGQITRWFFVATGSGGMILPWLFGWIFDLISPQAAMWAIMIDLLLASLLFSCGSILSKEPIFD